MTSPLSVPNSAVTTVPSLLFFNTVGTFFSQFQQTGIFVLSVTIEWNDFLTYTLMILSLVYFKVYVNAMLFMRISPIIIKCFQCMGLHFTYYLLNCCSIYIYLQPRTLIPDSYIHLLYFSMWISNRHFQSTCPKLYCWSLSQTYFAHSVECNPTLKLP